MQDFTDKTGKKWTLDINGYTLIKVKKDVGVDLTELEAPSPAPDGPPLAARLSYDIELQVAVIYAILEADIKAAELTEEQFARNLGPEGLRDGKAALARELSDFFQKLGRPDQSQILETHATFSTKATALSSSLLARIDLDGLLNSEIEKVEQELTQKFPGLFVPSGTGSTSSGASSVSTPGSSP